MNILRILKAEQKGLFHKVSLFEFYPSFVFKKLTFYIHLKYSHFLIIKYPQWPHKLLSIFWKRKLLVFALCVVPRPDSVAELFKFYTKLLTSSVIWKEAT